MNNYNLNSIVSRQEADALKEMIFKRVRERAESMTKDVNDSYTSNVHNDVMNLAREAFVSDSRNPFAISNRQPEDVVKQVESNKVEQKDSRDSEIGFPQRKIDDIKSQIKYRNTQVNEQIVNNALESNMEDARIGLEQNKGFMGALNFLNSQATIALVKNKGKAFDAIA